MMDEEHMQVMQDQLRIMSDLAQGIDAIMSEIGDIENMLNRLPPLYEPMTMEAATVLSAGNKAKTTLESGAMMVVKTVVYDSRNNYEATWLDGGIIAGYFLAYHLYDLDQHFDDFRITQQRIRSTDKIWLPV